ncbi:multiple epidermal growth factor-like domains protein 10 [Crassostrea angulata]|uniref:multiple epidermal growth factor-like domains protein 10 n=1 Tax=Magallana angulata TaxID=2784310 RepID=UPI0022B0F178|nr:multiple epidermal growth factor-like domains protein 10 [Crassostrea angulata]
MVMLIFMIFVAETYATLCQEKEYNNCCVDYEWDEILGNCTRCKPGFYRINCNKTCPYPLFGYGCQQMCNCSNEVCDFTIGCSKDETTNEVYAKDDVRDYRATPFNILSSFTMDNMSNLTLNIENSKDIVSLERFRTWFNSNSMSITMICIVVLVLIALLIIFIRKMIHKRNSQKHSY